MPNRVASRTVAYRSGFVEILPNIHPGCVNLETWWVDPEQVPADLVFGSVVLPEGAILGNVELELNLAEARQLLRILQEAIETVEQGGTNGVPAPE